jgi:hypothetical protein
MKFHNSIFARRAVRSAMATLTLAGVLGAGTLTACGGGSSDPASSATSSSAANGTSLASGYKQAKWAAGMTVTYPRDCTMKVVATGLPNHVLPAYDLRPATGSYTTVVATTPDGLALTLQPDPGALNPVSLLFNICPTKVASTTVSNMGTIGTMISGAALFNAYDGTGSPAMQQNVSYTFTDTAGKTQTAAFLDSCNGHYTPAQNGNVYHYHGVSGCVTAQVDACNGITSATPEFPGGVYHYVLPEGVTSEKSSMGCYSAAVSAQTVAQAQANGICTTGASGGRRLLAAVRMPPRKLIPRAV